VSLPIVCEDLIYSQLNQCTRENGCELDEDECVALGEADPPKTPEAGKETKPVKCKDLPLTACLSQPGCVVDQSEGECANAPEVEAGEAAEGGEPVEAGDAAEDAAKAAARAAEAEKERQEEAAEAAEEAAEAAQKNVGQGEAGEPAESGEPGEATSEFAGETAETHAEMAENAVEFHSEMAENSAELAEGVVENQFQWAPKENTGGNGNGVVPVLQKPKQFVDPEEMMEGQMEAQEEQRERAEEAAEFAAENPGMAGVGSNNQPYIPDVFAPNSEAAEEAAEASQENAEAAAEQAEEAAEAAAESGIGGIVNAPGTGNTDTTAAASDSSGSDAGSDSGSGADTTAAAAADTTAAASDSSGSNAGSGSGSDGADATAAATSSAAPATSSAAPGVDSGLPGLPNFLKVPKVCATVTTPEQCSGPSVAPDGEMPELGERPEWVCQWNTFTNGCVAMKFRHAMAGSIIANGGGIPNVIPAAGMIPAMGAGIEAEDYCPSILDPTKCVGMCRWIPYRNQCREIDLARSQMKPEQQSEPAESFKVTPTQVLITGIAFLLSVALGACIGIKYKHRSSSELASVPLNRYVDVDSYNRV